MLKLIRLSFAALLLSHLSAHAASKDITGSKDHPLISRYPDTHTIQYRTSDFDALSLPVAQSVNVEGDFRHTAKLLEGKLTTIEYQSDKTSPFLQVVRNYESALTQSGFKTLFSCDGREQCGPTFVLNLMKNEQWRMENLTFDPISSDSAGSNNYSYWGGVLHKDNADIYVRVLFGQNTQHPAPTEIMLDVLETKPMVSGLVSVNTKFLSDALASEGKVVLQGILFDTDKADIKAESAIALKAIADYLSQNKLTKVFVVGHTDTTGDYHHNVELSGQRAQAVVAALTATYKIEKSRLLAVGVGPVAPIGSNKTDEGKAKNRRVEMVLN